MRRLAAETLGLPTSPYRFVSTEAEALDAARELGLPCVLKPLMSSSGHGQTVVKTPEGMAKAWQFSQEDARSGAGRCIVEGFIRFDYEITMLTVSAMNGIQCCPPIGHIQIDGDYRESWQPCPMSEKTLAEAERIAKTVVKELGGFGIFGVECFVCGEEVIFSEVSPRPHDTGLVTIGSQMWTEFGLHARAILGLPVPPIRLLRPACSVAILGQGNGVPRFSGLEQALAVPESHLRLFGKPECRGHRRLAVAVASADTLDEARERARLVASLVTVTLD
ncbi:MAG TPA: formate-dependent phosphoribosylglycinamide formyltransferase [Opitutales bacterium]|nr:formate-dependent phosphoribosylglycinamide formyltransferase [Opitutales bacterium]